MKRRRPATTCHDLDVVRTQERTPERTQERTLEMTHRGARMDTVGLNAHGDDIKQ